MNNRFILSILINAVITVFEIIVGIAIGSLALISDALHNFTDVGTLALSWFGERVAGKESDEKKTYGYKRAEIIVAFINSSVLLAIILFILYQAFIRMISPHAVEGITMAWVAAVALAGNSIVTFLLRKNIDKNINLRSAWLHSLQDAVLSFGVIIGALIISFTGWYMIDPLISIVLSIVIIREVFRLLRQAIDILMESVPGDIVFDEVKRELLNIASVKQVADLHIWQTGSRNRFLSVHLKVDCADLLQADAIIGNVQKAVLEKFKINHSTVQVNPLNGSNAACLHCN